MVEASADPCDSMTREQIKEHLLNIAERHIAESPSYRQLRSDPAIELDVRMSQEAGVHLTVVKMKGRGLKVEDVAAFWDPEVFATNMKVLDPILTCTRLPNDMGEHCYALYQHIKTPVIVSNRCNFLAIYHIHLPNGGMIHLATSKGTKHLEQEHAQRIGKDVLGHTVMTYTKVEPCEDGSGIQITSVFCVDPAGSLPDFIKEKIAKENSASSEKMVAHLRKQKGLK